MKNRIDKEEISLGLSLLKKNKIEINLPKNIRDELDDNILFRGHDLIFKKLIKKSKVYLEYGSGKSTLWTLKNTNTKVYSIETDKEWYQKIFENINKETKKLDIKLVDIGPVINWGRPINYNYYKNFNNYTDFFWKKNIQPDLVLIDGRFRVCSFLTSLKYAQEGTFILFDDYVERGIYHIVESFIKKYDQNLEQALFKVPPKSEIDFERLEEMINNFRFVVD